MSVRITVLGSGSSGNVTLISSERVKVLLDLGLSARETSARLAAVGVLPQEITAVVVTHEHADHVRGLAAFARNTGAVVYISDATLKAAGLEHVLPRRESVRAGEKFEIGDMVFIPFSTPHDAADPLAYSIECHGIKISQVTDLGYISALVKNRIEKSDCLIVESNHDLQMLRLGPYPWMLKQRILGRHGHLSNHALAEFLAGDFDGYARYIFLAHLSRTNNHPDIAMLSARQALAARADLLEGWQERLRIAHPDSPSEGVELE